MQEALFRGEQSRQEQRALLENQLSLETDELVTNTTKQRLQSTINSKRFLQKLEEERKRKEEEERRKREEERKLREKLEQERIAKEQLYFNFDIICSSSTRAKKKAEEEKRKALEAQQKELEAKKKAAEAKMKEAQAKLQLQSGVPLSTAPQIPIVGGGGGGGGDGVVYIFSFYLVFILPSPPCCLTLADPYRLSKHLEYLSIL